MSVQIFLQSQLLGVDEFLSAPGADPVERAWRVSALTEELPRAFLAGHGLSEILLGSSGGAQFLLVLPQEQRTDAEEFFRDAAADIARESDGRLRLIFAMTENLGTWALIRDRFDADLSRQAGSPGQSPNFEPFDATMPVIDRNPARSVLRGDVDNFQFLLRGADSIESHVSLSVLYRNFFAGEIPRLAEPEKADVIFAGGNSFAVLGDWQALIRIAAEANRLFDRFIDENLKDRPGPEGKTLSMALAIPEPGESLSGVFARSGRMLEDAKAVTRGGFRIFDRAIEARQIPEAESIKDHAVRLVSEFGCSTAFLDELRSFYPESQVVGSRRVAKFDRPWRFHRRLAVSLDPNQRRARSKEFEKTRTALASEIIGKNVGQARLRPTGRVALEWARRVIED